MDTTRSGSLAENSSSVRKRPMERLFAWMLRDLHSGSLRITFPSGAFVLLGDSGFPLC